MTDTHGPWAAFAGIDWGGEHHQLCVVDTTGSRLTQLRVTHDVPGLVDLDTELTRFATRMPVAIERSEGLLVEHLQARGHAVFPVSPRIAARARERYRVAAVKDDRFDAFVLADTLRHEHSHWRALAVLSPLLAEIGSSATRSGPRAGGNAYNGDLGVSDLGECLSDGGEFAVGGLAVLHDEGNDVDRGSGAQRARVESGGGVDQPQGS